MLLGEGQLGNGGLSSNSLVTIAFNRPLGPCYNLDTDRLTMPNSEIVTLIRTKTTLDQPTQEADAVQVPRRIGKVVLLREIGRGAMGVVWLGHDEMLGRNVAVKFLLEVAVAEDDPHFTRFLEGARAAAAVHHPSLTTIYHADLIERVPYLVMEYVDGPPLSDVLKTRGMLSPSVATTIMLNVSEAISLLHDRGIVHRDIKPGNIMLSTSGAVFVTDFGLSCSRIPPGSSQRNELIAGTPAYMAPEMFKGTLSSKTDVYALGVTLFELLTRRVPYATAVGQGDIFPSVTLPVEPLTEQSVPQPVIDLIDRALNGNPLYRTKTARQFNEALQRACKDSGTNFVKVRELAELTIPTNLRDSETTADTPTITPIPTSSYLDRLSKLAARHKIQSSKRVNTAGAPEKAPILPGFLAPKYKCVRCSYNLGGTHISGKCPECGYSIFLSIQSIRQRTITKFDLRPLYNCISLLQIASLMLVVAMVCKIVDKSRVTYLFVGVFAFLLSSVMLLASKHGIQFVGLSVHRITFAKYRIAVLFGAWATFAGVLASVELPEFQLESMLAAFLFSCTTFGLTANILYKWTPVTDLDTFIIIPKRIMTILDAVSFESSKSILAITHAIIVLGIFMYFVAHAIILYEFVLVLCIATILAIYTFNIFLLVLAHTIDHRLRGAD